MIAIAAPAPRWLAPATARQPPSSSLTGVASLSSTSPPLVLLVLLLTPLSGRRLGPASGGGVGVQLSAPAKDAVPAGHGRHALAPCPANVPAGQVSHCAVSAFARVPGRQNRQGAGIVTGPASAPASDAPASVGALAARTAPVLHAWHWPPERNAFGGQSSQRPWSGDRYAFVHGWHELAPAAANVPAAHGAHAAPALAWYVPAGQGSHAS